MNGKGDKITIAFLLSVIGYTFFIIYMINFNEAETIDEVNRHLKSIVALILLYTAYNNIKEWLNVY